MDQPDYDHGTRRKALNNDVEELLSREMQSISFQERVLIQEEIHGVADLCPDETPELIGAALHAMQHYLDAIFYKPIYNQVSASSYIHTSEFRLRFLRREFFNSQKAAERLVRFTEYMYQEYGMEVLERPLRLSDLATKFGAQGKEIMKLFKAGYAQLLPYRDRFGRRVLFTHTKSIAFEDLRKVRSCIGSSLHAEKETTKTVLSPWYFQPATGQSS